MSIESPLQALLPALSLKETTSLALVAAIPAVLALNRIFPVRLSVLTELTALPEKTTLSIVVSPFELIVKDPEPDFVIDCAPPLVNRMSLLVFVRSPDIEIVLTELTALPSKTTLSIFVSPFVDFTVRSPLAPPVWVIPLLPVLVNLMSPPVVSRLPLMVSVLTELTAASVKTTLSIFVVPTLELTVKDPEPDYVIDCAPPLVNRMLLPVFVRLPDIEIVLTELTALPSKTTLSIFVSPF